MKIEKRILRTFVIFAVIVFLAVTSLVSRNIDHECNGDFCFICVCIGAKDISAAVYLLAVFSSAVSCLKLIGERMLLSFVSVEERCTDLVCLKVKLSD